MNLNKIEERIERMAVVKMRSGKTYPIKVVESSNQKGFISNRDAEMDVRAVQAVRKAVDKAKVCKKPIAKYDTETKKAYIEYSNGEKRYVR